MIMVSLGMLEGSYVTEGLCNATNEWQCELYQSDVEHYIPTFSVGRGSWQSEQASGFGSGPYDFGEVGNISRAAGTKSLSPQGWSSASKWLRIWWAQ